MKQIFSTIIFDLGGVIINLDEQKTITEFARYSRLSLDSIKDRILKFDAYFDLEMGKISEARFRDEIRSQFQVEASDVEIDACMNAMLLDIPMERLQLLTKLARQHQLFLLSNTNSIHLRKFNKIIEELTGVPGIDSFFSKTYYSHVVGMRKPNQEIFQKVIDDNKLEPSKTFFIDDNKSNIEGAQTVGIRTHHLTDSSQLFEIF